MERKFNILMLTDFDDPSYQAIPAVARMMGDLDSTLTIVHAFGERSEREDAERDLASFFAEAQHYPDSTRMAVEGPVEAVVLEYCRANPIDLIVAPAAERQGLPRLFGGSLRARLLERVACPIWTATTRRNATRTFGPVRRVGCYLSLDRPMSAHVDAAARFARSFGADLKLLHVVPTVDEGTLASGLEERPMGTPAAQRRIERILVDEGLDADSLIAVGDIGRELPRLIAESRLDVLFLGAGQVVTRSWARRTSLQSYVRRVPCPVVCFDGAAAESCAWPIRPRFVDPVPVGVRVGAIRAAGTVGLSSGD